MDVNNKTFVVHVTIKKREEMPVHSERQAQIEAQSGAQVGALLFDRVPNKVRSEYSDYNNVFSAKNVVELPENPKINEHAIKLDKVSNHFWDPSTALAKWS